MNKLIFFFILILSVAFCHCKVRRQIRPQPRRNFWPPPRGFRQNDIGFNSQAEDYYDSGDSIRKNELKELFGYPNEPGLFDGGRGSSGGGVANSPNLKNFQPTTTETTIHFSPEDCSCTFTSQYNPVCGTDGNTYKNLGLLNCYRQCGINVFLRRMGTC